MTSADRLIDHYAHGHPIERIEAELVAHGFDLTELQPGDVAGVDEFHLGGRFATVELLRSFRVGADDEVLDIGSGIGGVARTIAGATGCRVVGVDLTSVFVETASRLSEMVGLSDRTTFAVADANALQFDDDRFGAATLIHVGMNIDDKAALFAEVGRVLAPGGSLHIYDIMRAGDGEVDYPVPWSGDASTSFVEQPDHYVAALASAGFEVAAPVDRAGLVRDALSAAAASPPPVNLSHLMGDDWPTMFANLRSALAAGIVAPTEIVATRPSS